jgi:hypothetical protein
LATTHKNFDLVNEHKRQPYKHGGIEKRGRERQGESV